MISCAVVFAFAILVLNTLFAFGSVQNIPPGKCAAEGGLNGACKCTFSDNTYFDLSALRDANITTPPDTEFVYRYSPCVKFTWAEHAKNKGTCTTDNNAAVCQRAPGQQGGEPAYFLCGRLPTKGDPFIAYNESDKSYHASYKHGQVKHGTQVERTADVKLVCDRQLDHSLSIVQDVDIDYYLELRSKHACPRQPPVTRKHLSTGSILCITFFCLVFVYFVGGMLFLHFVRGASGQEMVPNVDFWKALPGYIKDGGVFVFSSCSKRGSGGYEKL